MEQNTDRLITAATAIVLGLTMYSGAKAAFPTLVDSTATKQASILKQASISDPTITKSSEQAPLTINSISEIPSGTIVKESKTTTFMKFSSNYKNFSQDTKSTIDGVDDYYYASKTNDEVMGIYNSDGTLVKSKSTDYHADTNAINNLDNDSNYIIVLNITTDISQSGDNATGKNALVFYKATGSQIKAFLQSLTSENYTFDLSRQNFFTEDTVLSDKYQTTAFNIINQAPTQKSLVKFYNAYINSNDNVPLN